MKPPQRILDSGRVITERALFDAPTSRAFQQRDSYSTFFGTSVNDEIERHLLATSMLGARRPLLPGQVAPFAGAGGPFWLEGSSTPDHLRTFAQRHLPPRAVLCEGTRSARAHYTLQQRHFGGRSWRAVSTGSSPRAERGCWYYGGWRGQPEVRLSQLFCRSHPDDCSYIALSDQPMIGTAHRQEFGLRRNWPDASVLLRARWIARTRRRFGAANERRNPHGLCDQKAGKGAAPRRVFAAPT